VSNRAIPEAEKYAAIMGGGEIVHFDSSLLDADRFR
jgi:hypothetical protein